MTRRHLATTIGSDHYRRQMAFVRERRRGNRTYYYLVESRREGNKVRQKVLKYLGTTLPTAEKLASLKEEFKDRLPPPR